MVPDALPEPAGAAEFSFRALEAIGRCVPVVSAAQEEAFPSLLIPAAIPSDSTNRQTTHGLPAVAFLVFSFTAALTVETHDSYRQQQGKE
jgi:hypothetical protein